MVVVGVVVMVGTPLSNRWWWQDQRHNYKFDIFPMHVFIRKMGKFSSISLKHTTCL